MFWFLILTMLKDYNPRSITNSTVILNSICKHGLTVPRSCSIRGSLKSEADKALFCYNQINLKGVDEAAALEALAYHDKEGMISIAMERNFSTDFQREMSLSSLCSVVFIFEIDKLWKWEDDVFAKNCYGETLVTAEKAKDKQIYFQEVRLQNGGIERSKVKAIMVPYHLVDEVRQIFFDIKVIPINAIEKQLIEDPIELFKQGYTARGSNIITPNYVRGLQNFRAEFPQLTQFGVHLTRLPLNYSIELDTGSYNKKYLKCFRLRSLSDKQEHFLVTDKRFLLCKESTKTILAYCSPENIKMLELIVKNFESVEKIALVIQRSYRSQQSKNVAKFFGPKLDQLASLKNEMHSLISDNEFEKLSQLAEQARKLRDTTNNLLAELGTSTDSDFLKSHRGCSL